jgi:succinate dehydrogenase/fumarate reductase flavoprotein subunit
MGGEAYALALRAGAELVDMEFVQFFPIGHLAPRLVGMDPIMWDPFRYKLGGKLLNGKFEEFIDRYGSSDFGSYNATRDVAAYAILKEVEAGRGTPHGGAYLDFRRIPEATLRAAFGPVIDRLLKNGIDLSKMPVEVGPMAHYHMGGIRVDTHMASRVRGLYAAGEAVGGANGANRLSGNAITEAFVFGHRAGLSAAEFARRAKMPSDVSWPRRVQNETRALLEAHRTGDTSVTRIWRKSSPARSSHTISILSIGSSFAPCWPRPRRSCVRPWREPKAAARTSGRIFPPATGLF